LARGYQVEFKETLPDRSGKVHPWLRGQTSVGDYPRDEILSEMVAFASSQGGSVFLGIAETSDNPTRADAAVPLPPVGDPPIGRKGWLQIATFPGNCIGAVFPRLSPLFPEAVAAPNILYTGCFTSANAMLNVANCIANAGRIESGESYKFLPKV
jgi:hypothetical protein